MPTHPLNIKTPYRTNTTSRTNIHTCYVHVNAFSRYCSAGGILSLLLATGYTPAECDDIYMFAAPHIFGHQPWRVINPWRAKYSDKNKQEIFQHYFGDRTMIDLKKTALVVAFRLDGRKSTTHSFFNKEGWRPAVFSNMPRGVGKRHTLLIASLTHPLNTNTPSTYYPTPLSSYSSSHTNTPIHTNTPQATLSQITTFLYGMQP